MDIWLCENVSHYYFIWGWVHRGGPRSSPETEAAGWGLTDKWGSSDRITTRSIFCQIVTKRTAYLWCYHHPLWSFFRSRVFKHIVVQLRTGLCSTNGWGGFTWQLIGCSKSLKLIFALSKSWNLFMCNHRLTVNRICQQCRLTRNTEAVAKSANNHADTAKNAICNRNYDLFLKVQGDLKATFLKC